MYNIIHGEIWSQDFTRLENLIKDFQSCVRFCYNRFHKQNLKFNEVRNLAKEKYPTLNTRQISDATLQGQSLQIRHKDKKIIFGGRKNWEDYKFKKITKEQWTEIRNNQIYSRGDATKFGNPNLRIIKNQLRITIGNKQFINYKLFIPNKFKQQLNQLIESKIAYNIRLVRKDNQRYKVVIDYKTEPTYQSTTFENGAIGVDTNPDRIAVANISKDGNLIETKSIINNRILCGSTNKRDYDIGCLVKQIINYAKKYNKGIVFENLKFEKNFKSYEKKWNRIKSNFAWRKFTDLLERKCIQNEIEYKKVNPAFTSIIGKYKYQRIYKITIHESAAFVIGRRGLGFNEKLSFYGYPKSRVKSKVLRTLAGKYQNQRFHSWKLWKALNDYVKATLTVFQLNLHNLKELCDIICDESENLSGETFLLELITGSNSNSILANEGSPSKFL